MRYAVGFILRKRSALTKWRVVGKSGTWIEIKSAYEPPIEGEEIKFGLVIKDENGNAMYVWSALQIDRGKLSMTIYQKPFDLGLESPYHQEDEIKEPYMTGMGVAAHVVYPIGLLAYASEYPEVKKMSVGDEIYELDLVPNNPSGEQFKERLSVRAHETVSGDPKKIFPEYTNYGVIDTDNLFKHDVSKDNPYENTIFKRK